VVAASGVSEGCEPDGDGVAAAVEARDLVKRYGPGPAALDGVSLQVGPGCFVAVMGPSGSGKSSLLHMLGALDRPTSGEVVVGGQALAGLSDDGLSRLRRRRIGFVFQSFNLVPVLTLADNVALPGVIDGRPAAAVNARVADLLEAVGLSGEGGKLPSQVSGGQQQRAAIARALLLEPAVVLADEPTGNLDSRSGTEILALLRRCQTGGATVVMVTHDPRAAAWSDEVVMVVDGRVVDRFAVEAGAPPGTPLTALEVTRRAHTVLTRLDSVPGPTPPAPAPAAPPPPPAPVAVR
jgi:putative ABC transport system ATP-binding protein